MTHGPVVTHRMTQGSREGDYAGQVCTPVGEPSSRSHARMSEQEGRMGAVIQPGDVHRGLHDGDDPVSAVEAVMQAAIAVEPEVTTEVLRVAEVIGGEVSRLASRLKERESALAKLERFRRRKSPRYRLRPFNDALRYTIVLPDLIYWRASERVLDEFVAAGFAVVVSRNRWHTDSYKGLNVTFQSPDGFHFEVQLHTPRSLGAGELTHDAYAARRELTRDAAGALAQEQEEAEVWKRVPVPPGGPTVD